MSEDAILWNPYVEVRKYSPDQVKWAVGRSVGCRVEGDELAALFPRPEEGIAQAWGNSLTEAGALNLAHLIAGDGQGIPISATTAFVGVGADASANVGSPARHGTLSPEDGEGPGRTFYQCLDRGYPQVAAPRIVRFKMTATEHQANHEWQEWGVAVAPEVRVLSGHTLSGVAEGAVLMNRKAVSLGLKEEGRSWVFACSLRVG